jgi:CRISPR/Cas system-associated exonuclease Cas4 (RecB family)
MNNERQNLPSASSAQRYATCPGSFLLEQQAPDEPTSEDAELGNRVHAWLAEEDVSLDADELELATKCLTHEQDLLRSVFGHAPKRVIREHRIWAFDRNLHKAWSGKPDSVYIDGHSGLVIDYKTGRGDVEQAASNLQLRALAVLAFSFYGLRQITVAIIQPLAGQPTHCTYSLADLIQSENEIDAIMASVRKPGQPRNPSVEACKYCKAKAICPEARESALLPALSNLPENITPDAIAATLTGPTLGQFLERAKLAESVIEACRKEAERRLSEGEQVEGWTLSPGDIRETITFPETVFSRFLAANGTYSGFMRSVKITKKGLKEALRNATGKKGKKLDEKMESILSGCTESKASKAVLTQINKLADAGTKTL